MAPAASVHPQGADLKCPICGNSLVRATGENIPDNITVYSCADGHGYFFPAGQLATFKKAQKTKIEYHRLWNIPLPSVRSVLLTGLLVVILTGGFIAAYVGVQNRQTSSSQARELLTSVHAYVTPKIHEVLISGKTDFETTVKIHIPTLNNFEKVMDSADLLTHTLIVKEVPQGSYQYYFTLEFLGEEVQSQTYTFVMPQ